MVYKQISPPVPESDSGREKKNNNRRFSPLSALKIPRIWSGRGEKNQNLKLLFIQTPRCLVSVSVAVRCSVCLCDQQRKAGAGVSGSELVNTCTDSDSVIIVSELLLFCTFKQFVDLIINAKFHWFLNFRTYSQTFIWWTNKKLIHLWVKECLTGIDHREFVMRFVFSKSSNVVYN